MRIVIIWFKVDYSIILLLGLDDGNSRWVQIQVGSFYLAIKGKPTSQNREDKTEKQARKWLTRGVGLCCCILTRVGIWELEPKIYRLHSNALLSGRAGMKIRIKAPKRQKWNIDKKKNWWWCLFYSHPQQQDVNTELLLISGWGNWGKAWEEFTQQWLSSVTKYITVLNANQN